MAEFTAAQAALTAWRAAHPTATFAEIEAAVDQHLSAARATLIGDLAAGVSDDRPSCPACATRMVRNGTRSVTVTTAQEGQVPLTGAQYVCPACGVGLFPPR